MATYTAQNDIISVFQTKLLELTTVNRSDIVFINTSYNSSVNPYVEVFHLPVDMYQASLGTYGQYRFDGLFQVDVNVPVGSGRSVINPILSEVRELFKPGTLLTNDNISVRCKAVWEASPYLENNWYTVPVNMRYYAYTDNL